MEEEEKNDQGFIKEQTSKLKEKGKEEAKKQIKKKIMTFVMAHLPIILYILAAIIAVVIVIVLLAGFINVIEKSKSTNASEAKEAAISYGLGGSVGEEESEDTSTIKIYCDNGVYTISTNYSDEDIDSIKDEIARTGRDVSEFSDFEIRIIGALIEKGLDHQRYTTEQLKCLPLFIKTEGCTSNLDLRPNSQKFDRQGNYQPEKLENLKENEIPGVILVQRTNTSEEKPKYLEYIDFSLFNNMVSQKNLDVLNYFTIDEYNNLLVAKWKYTKIEVEGEYPSGIEGDTEKEEYIINEDNVEKIPYNEYVKKYTMPFDFLVYLLNITDEPDFCKELTKIVEDSKIVINIQEEETRTVSEDVQTYTTYAKEEKSVDFYINFSVKGQNDTFRRTGSETLNSSENKETKTVKVKETNISHTYSFEIKEADTWLAHYIKEYEKKDPENENPDKPQNIEELGEYETPIVTEAVPDENDKEIKEFEANKESELDDGQYNSVECNVTKVKTSVSTKIDKTRSITETVEKYPSDPNPTTSTPHIYAKDKDGNFEKFLLVYDKYPYARAMINSTSWLFDGMKESENTIDLIDPIKYLLYVYDGKDRGVTELDTSIFEPSEFKFNSGAGTEWWWPIGSSETREVNGVLYADGEPEPTSIASMPGERMLNGELNTHNGLDIAGKQNTNIIATKPGRVIKVVDGFKNGFGNENLENNDGGGFGNNILVEHDDGKLVRYAHLEKNTITVKEGDYVQQGQLIGKMGSSGKSTGFHLHFEIRDASWNVLLPQDYVDPNNPRPNASSIQKWLWEIEGGSQYINGKEWIVVDPDGPDDTMNLAHGMVIAEYNGGDSWYPDIIPGKIYEGDIVTEEQANAIWEVKIKGFKDAIDSSCVRYGVTLTLYQKDALISNIYRTGYGRGQNDALVSAYASGGNAGLWNYMKDTYDTRYPEGTKKRVAEEYELFVKGDYNYNPGSGTTKYNKFCSNPNI